MSTTILTLTRIDSLNVTGRAVTSLPIKPNIKELIDTGLITATPLRIEPLGFPSYDVWLRVTENGRQLLETNPNARQ